MMAIGSVLKVRLFGSSHGPVVGVEVEGLPRGTRVDPDVIQRDLDRRRPVGRRLATKRQEEDRLVVDSGVQDGVSDGSVLKAHVANEDVRRSAYDALKNVPRPGHADFPARARYGAEADLSGGGIFSGRMTVGLVIAGALAREVLRPIGIEAVAFTREIGGVLAEVPESLSGGELGARSAANEVGCPDAAAATRMEQVIAETRQSGDSVGGVVECRSTGVPVGLGEPFFDSIEGTIAHLAFSIPAVKAIEFGTGFSSARMKGSEHNDAFYYAEGKVRTRSNHSGGILGGLATGAPVVFRVAVKPTSSIAKPQESVDLVSHQSVTLKVAGRHDPCIVPRAVVVVEAVARIAFADLALRGGFA